VSRDHQPPLRDVTADTGNTASSTVACAYFERGLEMTFFYCRVLEHVYGAVAWQLVFTFQYLILSTFLKFIIDVIDEHVYKVEECVFMICTEKIVLWDTSGNISLQ
jgi:hypothetical protein